MLLTRPNSQRDMTLQNFSASHFRKRKPSTVMWEARSFSAQKIQVWERVLHGAACLKWATELLKKICQIERERMKERKQYQKIGWEIVVHLAFVYPQESLNG